MKKFLVDYAGAADESHMPRLPMIFTLTPCGSEKTLRFMQWLGFDIPAWLENDLSKTHDILSRSLEVCRTLAEEILEFAGGLRIPVGFNMESVAIRREEIEASLDLVRSVRKLQQKGSPRATPGSPSL